jgi:hypothetical protein
MGILADFFVATTEDARAYEALLMAEKAMPPSRYEVVRSGRLTGLELGLLWAILEAVPWNVDRHMLDFQDPENIADHIDDEDFEVSTWLEKFPTAFVRNLSLVTDDGVADIATQWGACEELACDGSELEEIVRDLRRLAQHAIEVERDLFLWGSL